MNCQKCKGMHDVVDFYIGEERHCLCYSCRMEFLYNRKVGRPKVGITKKTSLTLTEDDWNWIDKQEMSKSELVRLLIQDRRRNEI